MLSEPRTINFLTDLIHIPMAHDVGRLREAYNQLCNACGYEDFNRTPEGARLDSGQVEGQQRSTLHFRRDRLQMTEDRTRLSLEQYLGKVQAVATVAFQTLKIPVIVAQQTTVRAIFTPNFFKSADQFLAKNLLRVSPDDFGALERPGNVVGLRLMFPPTGDHPQKLNVRIETYLKEPRSLYVENVATYQMPIQPAQAERIQTNVETAANFISENVWRFLSQFDTRDEDS